MKRSNSSMVMVAAVVALTGLAATVGFAGEASESETTALLVIDVQAFYFEGGSLPLEEPVAASEQAGKLINGFRTAGWPVIHVQHLPKDQNEPDPAGGNPQYRIHPNVMPAPKELVIGKHHANSFRDTDLLAELLKLGVKKLVIAGMQTQMCVEAATRAAADFGFKVTLVHDACATRDLTFNGVEVPAKHVHAATLAAMKGSYAEVVSTAEYLAAME